MANEWFISDASGEHGPYSSSELKQRAEQGLVTPNLQVCRGKDGTADGHWVEASKVKGLFPDVPLPVLQPAPMAIPVGRPVASETIASQPIPQIRFCPDCGNTVSVNASCCPSCGCPSQDAAGYASTPSKSSQSQESAGVSASAIVLCLIGVSLLGIAIYQHIDANKMDRGRQTRQRDFNEAGAKISRLTGSTHRPGTATRVDRTSIYVMYIIGSVFVGLGILANSSQRGVEKEADVQFRVIIGVTVAAIASVALFCIFLAGFLP